MPALEQLVALKNVFGSDPEQRVAKLLERLASTRVRDPEKLILLHETVLFLRAYPHGARVLRLADKLLFAFERRLQGVDPWPFEAGEVSGIVGTALSTNYSHAFAKFLSARHGKKVKVDWDSYAHADRLGPVLARLAPLALEDWSVEPHIDWRRWFEALQGDVAWLVENLDPATYDSLELVLWWTIDAAASRTFARLPRSEVFYHKEPLLKRRDVSLEAELASKKIPVRRLSQAEANRVLDVIISTNAVRYRELWGFSFPDAKHVYHADFGRGLDLYWFGVPPTARLPLRAYHGGAFFKNGVPLGYIETLSFFDRMEVGFNLYYTFRDGESAWLYARFLKFCQQQCGVTCFSIDPYQIGHENEEGIESGAFWFYRKLGFRSASDEIQKLVEKEEKKLAERPGYRTPPAMLRRLAKAPVLYGSTLDDWKSFSLRTFAQKIGRGEAWPAIVSRVRSETSAEEIVRAKNATEEVGYLRLLQRSPQLRKGILRLGQPAKA
ncbi:MAG: hypothetical protein ABIR70_03655 [Bryobacteraceae bacterium]